ATQLPHCEVAQPEPKKAEPSHHEEPPPDPTPGRIDMLIRAGSFEAALKLGRAAPADHRPTAYRTGLCLEGLGRWKDAAEAYHPPAEPDGDVAAWARALLGQARCAAAEGELAEAQELLERVSVRAGPPDCRERHIIEECLFLRARLELLRLGTQREPDP